MIKKPNYVLVLDTNKTPLIPCKPSMAAKLLKAGKAAVYRRFPFTIILKKRCQRQATSAAKKSGSRQEYISNKPKLELKIAPGSKTTGLALVLNHYLIWCAELNQRSP